MDKQLAEKLEWVRANRHRFSFRDAQSLNPKNKMLHIAKISVRSEAVGGGAVPEDEVQLDFCISNGERDSFGSIMTEKTLKNYAEDAAAGVGFMRDHAEGVNTQIGRTIAATYDEAEKRVVATISMLRDSDDTPENMRVNEYIRRIERKYYDSCSVAFRDADETCNICHRDIFPMVREGEGQGDYCPHYPKETYDGVVCTYNVDNARLRHVGLVVAPSNPNAKLLDTREWSEALRSIKKHGDGGGDPVSQGKSLLERDGEKYRESLIKTALEEGVRAEDDFDEAVWRERFKSRDADEIIAQTATWTALGDARWGKGGRSTEGGSPSGTSGQRSDDTVLILPPHLFNY